MCPSYMATRNEADSTRARANLLRQVLTHPENLRNPWDSAEVADVMDLCLSCKGCKAECPSNVDVAKLKAEWQQHYYDAHGVPLRSRVIAGFAGSMRAAALAPALYNWAVRYRPGRRRDQAPPRLRAGAEPPPLHGKTLAAWHRRAANRGGPHPNGRVHLFCDEFTNYNDTPVGIRAVQALNRLGYEVIIPPHLESGRAHLSKGLIRDARRIAIRNVELLQGVVTEEAPLIGLEPSAILTFRDEYPELVPANLKAAASRLGGRALLFDEFIVREADRGRIRREAFTDRPQKIKLHGHCHQKALASIVPTVRMLELPVNYKVQVIPSGCCGMAGSFGYEAEHFRDLPADRGARPLPRCARDAGGHAGRGAGNQLPPPDQGRHGPDRPAPGGNPRRGAGLTSAAQGGGGLRDQRIGRKRGLGRARRQSQGAGALPAGSARRGRPPRSAARPPPAGRRPVPAAGSLRRS